MENTLAVANFFVEKSFQTGERLTPMKLVKLVYISHGWHLAFFGEPLIPEATQAWKFGPVVPSVYHEFKQYRDQQITSLALDIQTLSYPKVEDEKTIAFLEKIWDTYGHYTGLQLSSLTHQNGTPWSITWELEGGKNNPNVIIPNDRIEKYYIELGEKD